MAGYEHPGEAYKVAIVGKSGVGKSTLINAYFRLGHESPEAARSDVIEATTEPLMFHLPGSAVALVDTPGFGTQRIPEGERYFSSINFDSYDFYILVSCNKVNEFEKKVAERILRNNKRYFYVRSKMGQALKNEQRSHPRTYNEDDTLKDIREKISQALPQCTIFFVESFQTSNLDFRNMETLVPFAAQWSRENFENAERNSRDRRTAEPSSVQGICTIL